LLSLSSVFYPAFCEICSYDSWSCYFFPASALKKYDFLSAFKFLDHPGILWWLPCYVIFSLVI
jgi:hypothetical protein